MADDDTGNPDAAATKRDLEELRGRLGKDMRALLEEFAEKITASAGRNAERSERRISAKYRPLADYLMGLSWKTRTLTFEQVERKIGADLPPSARDHPKMWWSNSWGVSQSSAWLSAGWRVAAVDPNEEKVRFARVGGRLRPSAADMG